MTPFSEALISRNEQVEVDAKKTFYQNLKIKQEKKLKSVKKIALVYIPILELVFMAVYWYQGMKHYNKPV